MSEARDLGVLVERIVYFADGRYEARIKVLKIPKSLKFPDGFKVSCVLLDTVTKNVRLVLDNHQPFGYHVHTELPHNKNARLKIELKNYNEAIKFFFKEVRKLANEEK
jgi:hypothetical protein